MSMYKTVEVKARINNNVLNVSSDMSDSTILASGNTVTKVSTQPIYDYEPLTSKPSIEEVTLSGNKTFRELGLRRMTNLEIEAILQS